MRSAKTSPTTKPAEQATVRADGRKRVLRGLLKQPPFYGLIALGGAVPGIHEHIWLQLFWVVWATYFGVTGRFDVVTGLQMQAGIQAQGGIAIIDRLLELATGHV